MAKANPVNRQPEAPKAVVEVAAPVENDPRRPVLAPEITGLDKPKNSYKQGDTLIEDF